jgi:hypothetical protein
MKMRPSDAELVVDVATNEPDAHGVLGRVLEAVRAAGFQAYNEAVLGRRSDGPAILRFEVGFEEEKQEAVRRAIAVRRAVRSMPTVTEVSVFLKHMDASGLSRYAANPDILAATVRALKPKVYRLGEVSFPGDLFTMVSVGFAHKGILIEPAMLIRTPPAMAGYLVAQFFAQRRGWELEDPAELALALGAFAQTQIAGSGLFMGSPIDVYCRVHITLAERTAQGRPVLRAEIAGVFDAVTGARASATSTDVDMLFVPYAFE